MDVRHSLTLLTIALAAPLAACSGGDETSDPAGNKPGGDGNKWGLAAQPCANINSGYDGDELCIEAPPPDIGMQMHYGPANYSPAEVEKWLIHPGEEITDCIYLDTPNETEIFYNEYHGRMRPGSHHMLLYVSDGENVEDSLVPRACTQGLNQRNIFGAQEMITDVKRQNSAPENEGLAVKLTAKQQGVMQLHFFNTGDKPQLREAWANLIYTDPKEVKQLGDPIFFIGGYLMSVQPKTTQIIKGTATVPPEAGPAGVRLVIGTGHYHAHTVRFTAHKVVGGKREFLMEDYDWHDPALMHFDSQTQNPSGDPVAKQAGAHSGIVQLGQGDQIEWECEIVNNDKNFPLTFGNKVYDAEMCNMFGLYAPSIGKAWTGVGL